MQVFSVVLVDANPTFLHIATRLLQDYYQQELTVVGTSDGSDGVLEQVQRLKPDIILLGVGQHSLTGLRLIPRLRAMIPATGIIVLGSLDIHAYRQAALDAGADDFVAKVAMNNTLLPTIHAVMNGTSAMRQKVIPDDKRDTDDRGTR